MRSTLLLAVVTAASFAFFAAAPAAAKSTEFYAARIHYGDLNLNNDTGADAMINRIRRTGRDVCGYYSRAAATLSRQQLRACSAEFEERAVAQLNHPIVTARFRSRQGVRLAAH